MLGKAKLIDAFTPGSHASTFGGTPIATAAAIATVEQMLEDNLPERVARMGEYLMGQLSAKLAENPLVKQVRGMGLLIGIECAQPAAEMIADIHRAGLFVVPAGPNVIRLLPNFLVTREEIDRGVDIICSVLARKAAAV
jgi:acetylornithine aminotransferase